RHVPSGSLLGGGATAVAASVVSMDQYGLFAVGRCASRAARCGPTTGHRRLAPLGWAYRVERPRHARTFRSEFLGAVSPGAPRRDLGHRTGTAGRVEFCMVDKAA